MYSLETVGKTMLVFTSKTINSPSLEKIMSACLIPNSKTVKSKFSWRCEVPKYKLTANHKRVLNGVVLYQIQALRDFGTVLKGDLGGWIEKESNLSQDGNAWVSGNALVCGDAIVSGNALVYGDAIVYGNAMVYGYTWVYGNAMVYGDAKVYGNAWVYGNATIQTPAPIPLTIQEKVITKIKQLDSEWQVKQAAKFCPF